MTQIWSATIFPTRNVAENLADQTARIFEYELHRVGVIGEIHITEPEFQESYTDENGFHQEHWRVVATGDKPDPQP